MNRGELGDVGFLQRILGGHGLAGPGDDAAWVATDRRTLVCIDPVVEGGHFTAETAPALVGRKLVNRNFSDLAAMGGWPRAVLVSCCFGPGWTTRRRRALYRGIARAAARFGARWVGGDVAAIEGPAVFTCCALGTALGKRPVSRGGGRRGDRVFVTGPLGRSLASGWHLRFTPRLELARTLVGRYRVHAMIDVSDGLVLDLARLCAASGGLGATIDADAVPLRKGADLDAALGDGEDHELLVAVSARSARRIADDPDLPRAMRRPVAVLEEIPGIRLRRAGRTRRLALSGYRHALRF